jgi:hypothetical protein
LREKKTSKERDVMKKWLGAAAIIGAGFLAVPSIASATSLTGAASGGSSAQNTVQQVDLRPFRHCHGPRWDRRCHGGALFFRGGRDRWRDHDGYRYRERSRYRRDRDRDFD